MDFQQWNIEVMVVVLIGMSIFGAAVMATWLYAQRHTTKIAKKEIERGFKEMDKRVDRAIRQGRDFVP